LVEQNHSGEVKVININLDLKSKVPIYIQIRDQLRLLIATGELNEGAQMPPVRDLASDLLINPNTVTKAYHELEHENFIHTRRGMGTFVSSRTESRENAVEKSLAPDLAREFVTRMLDMGLTSEEIRKYVDEMLQ